MSSRKYILKRTTKSKEIFKNSTDGIEERDLIGSVDAVAVTLNGIPARAYTITPGAIFKFNVVNVNIRGGYDPSTGNFSPF